MKNRERNLRIENGNKSSKRKGKEKSKEKWEMKVQIEYGGKQMNGMKKTPKKTQFLRPRYKIAVKKWPLHT